MSQAPPAEDDWFNPQEPAIPQVREWAINHVTEEWNERTWYGKLWYPFWLLMQTLTALTLGMILMFITGEPLKTVLGQATSRAYGWWVSVRPAVYREDSREST